MIDLWSSSSQYVLLLIGTKVVLVHEVDDGVNVSVILSLRVLVVKQAPYLATIPADCHDGK